MERLSSALNGVMGAADPQEFVALYGRVVVVMEDVQHLDSASSALLAALLAAAPRDVLLVASFRPWDAPLAGDADRDLRAAAALPKALQVCYRPAAGLLLSCQLTSNIGTASWWYAVLAIGPVVSLALFVA